MVARFFMGLSLIVTPAAALAAGTLQAPGGSQALLFAVGILGVIVGRRASMRKPGDDPKQD
jgi:altronate dehydratase